MNFVEPSHSTFVSCYFSQLHDEKIEKGGSEVGPWECFALPFL